MDNQNQNSVNENTNENNNLCLNNREQLNNFFQNDSFNTNQEQNNSANSAEYTQQIQPNITEQINKEINAIHNTKSSTDNRQTNLKNKKIVPIIIATIIIIILAIMGGILKNKSNNKYLNSSNTNQNIDLKVDETQSKTKIIKVNKESKGLKDYEVKTLNCDRYSFLKGDHWPIECKYSEQSTQSEFYIQDTDLWFTIKYSFEDYGDYNTLKDKMKDMSWYKDAKNPKLYCKNDYCWYSFNNFFEGDEKQQMIIIEKPINQGKITLQQMIQIRYDFDNYYSGISKEESKAYANYLLNDLKELLETEYNINIFEFRLN